MLFTAALSQMAYLFFLVVIGYILVRLRCIPCLLYTSREGYASHHRILWILSAGNSKASVYVPVQKIEAL